MADNLKVRVRYSRSLMADVSAVALSQFEITDGITPATPDNMAKDGDNRLLLTFNAYSTEEDKVTLTYTESATAGERLKDINGDDVLDTDSLEVNLAPGMYVPVGAEGYDADGNLVVAKESEDWVRGTGGLVVFLDPGDYGDVNHELTEAEVLVVAGGAKGGDGSSQTNGAGGGAGGVRNATGENVYEFSPAEEHTVAVKVGAGGITGNGENSQFGELEAIGGGQGGGKANPQNGESGGSGGGGQGGSAPGSGGAAETGQGNPGGNGSGSSPWRGGGGGGKEAAGASGTEGGDGGDGIDLGLIFSNKFGANGKFAGGGGGGCTSGDPGEGKAGAGDGLSGNTAGNGNPGQDNTGSGGGGGRNNDNSPGGPGGSGIVVVKWGDPVLPEVA